MSSPQRVYRLHENTIGGALGLGVPGAIIALMGFARDAEGGSALPVGARLGFWIAGIAMVGFAFFRIRRAGLVVAPDGVTILNPFKTVRIPWQEVGGIELERGAYHTHTTVRRRDGAGVRVFALGGANPGVRPRSHARLTALVAELQQLVEQQAPRV
jgi:hypothetical protein